MPNEPNLDDFKCLKEHFDSAVAAQDNITWIGDYPEYPEAVTGLMRYIATSPWCYYEYQPGTTQGILDRLDSANLVDVRSVLTAISRSERFCTGSWRSALQEGRLSAVIERAKKITEAEQGMAGQPAFSP